MGEALHHCFTRATQFVFPWLSKLHISLGLKNRLSLCWKESLETTTLVKFHDPDPTWITNVGNNWITMKRVSILSCFSHVWLCDPMDCRPPGSSLSMGFSRQEYWSGLPCPPPGGLPNPGIKPKSLTSPALAGGFSTTSITWEAHNKMYFTLNLCWANVDDSESTAKSYGSGG